MANQQFRDICTRIFYVLIQEVSEAHISGNFYKVVVQLVRLYWLDIFVCLGVFGAYILFSGAYGWWEECYI